MYRLDLVLLVATAALRSLAQGSPELLRPAGLREPLPAPLSSLRLRFRAQTSSNSSG